MSLVFTCNACMIQFRSSDQQRYHMKTDWHRYNLKRKVAQLGPISADLFAEKVQISEREKELNQVDEFGFAVLKKKEPSRHKSAANGKTKLKKKRGRQFENVEDTADPARSTSPAVSIASEISKMSIHSTDFDDERSYENGFTTNSEEEYTTDYETEASEIDTNQQKDVQFSHTECLFCGRKSRDLEGNISHMFRSHGLYIPERTFLVDLEGLINYLIELIVHSHQCLCCFFKGSSLESIRAHIASKGHAKLPYETKEERLRFSKFYDFSLAEQQSDDDSDASGCEVTVVDTEASSSPDESSSGDSPQDINSNYAQAVVDDTGVELTLPTGVRAGHRSMRRYYRQNLPLPPDAADGNRTLAVGDRRYLGGVTDRTIKKNDKKAQQLERHGINRKIRTETRRSNFQTHFRDELLQ
ncbi:LAME_0F07426g1_1 [Lachancea meyersii CBS 8951]|uniref:LAME_0F07426g1_1 n=1 Tax=Lachancea meyersii CBS 8951 TaxID=1266667 RepID=A0A1G4JU19_9SACH|nr:LAME_0F07426g1_1 [Lachancea meyersii CBS 8951]